MPTVCNITQARSSSLSEGFSSPEREFFSLSEIDSGDLISVFQMLGLVGYFKWLSMMHDSILWDTMELKLMKLAWYTYEIWFEGWWYIGMRFICWWIYVLLTFKLYVQLHDKNLFNLAYLFRLFVCLMCGFLLLRWSSIYWCEQMWELLVVVRVMEISPHSLSWVESRFLEFSFRVVAHVLPCSWSFYVEYCRIFFPICNGIMVCLSFPF